MQKMHSTGRLLLEAALVQSDGIYVELMVLIESLLCIQSNNDTLYGDDADEVAF